MHALAPLLAWVQQRYVFHQSRAMFKNSESERRSPVVEKRMGSGPAHDSDFRLTLPARPENIAVVRHVIGAFAEAVGLAGPTIDDMRLAVTEACTNVVRHAYENDGHIEIVIRPEGDAVTVIVSDDGRGIGPSPDVAGPGLGLPLIAALADRFEIERVPQRGSRLLMSFLRRRAPAQAVGAV
jgi:anti-sigma regulatory factor (Ser/Thr protein kinase)